MDQQVEEQEEDAEAVGTVVRLKGQDKVRREMEQKGKGHVNRCLLRSRLSYG